MSKPKTLPETITVPVEFPRSLQGYLIHLANLGFGNTKQEVLRYLIIRGMDDMFRIGLLNPNHQLIEDADRFARKGGSK